DEVVAGCGLILQMDPMFEPARKLLDKANHPGLPIDVDSLLPADSRSKIEQARAALADRDFQRVGQITNEILTEDLLNDEARVLGDEAREKIEAAPFVDQFTRRAEQSLTAGNVASAKMDLEKARALDPTHPEVVRLAMQINSRDSAPQRPQPTPSFVVDDNARNTSGRSTAQAADFGFTFEEEKPTTDVPLGAFSFDTPTKPAAKPQEQNFSNFSFDAPSSDSPFSFGGSPAASSPSEFDFATASVSANDDDARKIEQFLADGDRAFGAGDYQQAIDLWSRIFLIDVTNDQASDRIERAKAKRREIEQKVEAVLASGIDAFERGDTAKAHTDLSEVLRLDPNNETAQGYLDRLGETLAASNAPRANAFAPSGDDAFDSGFFDDELPSGGYEAPLIPPDPNAAPAATDKKKGKAKAKAAPKPAGPPRKLPMGAIIGVVAVLILGAAGYFAWSRFFSTPDEEVAGASEGVIERASALANAGQYDKAVALLREVQPGDPQHNRALVMLADLQQKKSSSAQLIDGIPAEQYYEQKITAAREAFEAHDFIGAKSAFEQAQRAKPLPADLKAMFDTATQQAAKLDAAKALFGERRYTEAISNLQSLLAQDPENQNIKRLIADAYFNIAAVALQEEKTTEAVKAFDEVLKIDPNDELARRSRELALRYDNESKDLLYKIYVKYLPLRKAA
ncbi:MAG TPA: tetratricopeptide repeat protein, partial [Thermoanaerobaculia bacterium]